MYQVLTKKKMKLPNLSITYLQLFKTIIKLVIYKIKSLKKLIHFIF